MIRSFGNDSTSDLFHGISSRKTRAIAKDITRAAIRKLDMINAANVVDDLRSPPGNRLETLKGDLRGFHSIRINDQWRIIFRWSDGAAEDVEIVDYHR